jgi:hypothetical protein
MRLAFLEGGRRTRSVPLASGISGVVSLLGGVAVTLALGFQPFLLLFIALFAYQNFLRARAVRQAAAPDDPSAAPTAAPPETATERADVDAATEQARAALLRRDFDTALAAAARLDAGGPFRQAASLRLRAGIELARGDNEAAALFAGQSYSIWQSSDAAVVAARANLRAGAEDRARNWLRRAVEAGAAPAAVRSDPELGALA